MVYSCGGNAEQTKQKHKLGKKLEQLILNFNDGRGCQLFLVRSIGVSKEVEPCLCL